MTIRVRRQDGQVQCLEELIGKSRNTPLLIDKINVKKKYFSVNINLRKNFIILLESDPDIFISFSDNRISDQDSLSDYNGIHANKTTCYKKTRVGTYSTTHLCSLIGKEDIFNLEKQGENLYKIIYPRK